MLLLYDQTGGFPLTYAVPHCNPAGIGQRGFSDPLFWSKEDWWTNMVLDVERNVMPWI